MLCATELASNDFYISPPPNETFPGKYILEIKSSVWSKWFSIVMNDHLVEKENNSDPLENSVVDDCVEDCSEEKTVSV